MVSGRGYHNNHYKRGIQYVDIIVAYKIIDLGRGECHLGSIPHRHGESELYHQLVESEYIKTVLSSWCIYPFGIITRVTVFDRLEGLQ